MRDVCGVCDDGWEATCVPECEVVLPRALLYPWGFRSGEGGGDVPIFMTGWDGEEEGTTTWEANDASSVLLRDDSAKGRPISSKNSFSVLQE